MAAQRTLALFRIWCVILLAVVGLQALAPMQAPLQRQTGSAFNSATSDVALSPTARRGDVAAPVALPALPPPELGQVHSLASLDSSVSPPIVRRFEIRGPPRDWPERLPDLRGPPLS
jgi:hypothetical protein